MQVRFFPELGLLSHMKEFPYRRCILTNIKQLSNILAPETYEELVTILAEHSVEDQLTILERLRKCHHPSLAEGNKEKLQVGFRVAQGST